jgi:hypothetical protein
LYPWRRSDIVPFQEIPRAVFCDGRAEQEFGRRMEIARAIGSLLVLVHIGIRYNFDKRSSKL